MLQTILHALGMFSACAKWKDMRGSDCSLVINVLYNYSIY